MDHHSSDPQKENLMIFSSQKVRHTDVPSCNLDILKMFPFFCRFVLHGVIIRGRN